MRNSPQFIALCLLILPFNISFAQNLSLVKDINTTAINNSFPHNLTVFNSKLYFVANNGVAHKLYVSDGTTAGTGLVGGSFGAHIFDIAEIIEQDFR